MTSAREENRLRTLFETGIAISSELSLDAVLQKIAELIRGHLRITDSACRLGGDEFVIVLPQTEAQAAVRLAETWRARIARENITISAGICEYTEGDKTDSLLNRVDIALYNAKQKGRNACVLI